MSGGTRCAYGLISDGRIILIDLKEVTEGHALRQQLQEDASEAVDVTLHHEKGNDSIPYESPLR